MLASWCSQHKAESHLACSTERFRAFESTLLIWVLGKVYGKMECPHHSLNATLSIFQTYSSHWILSTEWLEIIVQPDLYTVLTSFLYHLQREAICQFPSLYFYNGCLKADPSLKKRQIPGRSMDQFWPKGERLPIVFCNVVGREEGLSGVETDKEKIDPHSKCNKQEAEKVVSIDHQFYNMLCYNGFH